MVAASDHTARPTATPLAPSSQAIVAWRRKISKVAEPESKTQGIILARESSAQAFDQAD